MKASLTHTKQKLYSFPSMAANQQLLLQPSKPNSHFKTLTIILCLSATIIFSASIVSNHFFKFRPNPSQNNHSFLHNICEKAYNPSSCIAMASQVYYNKSLNNNNNNVHFLGTFLRKSTAKVMNSIEAANDLSRRTNDIHGQATLADCVELLEISMDRIMNSILVLQKKTSGSIEDVQTWLSSVLTNHVTCFDELEGSVSTKLGLEELIMRARNSLAMLVSISPSKEMELLEMEFPVWLKSGDRRLLWGVVGKEIKADIVVAKDGSGNFKTVKEAVEAVPDKSKRRFVIYVKHGIYEENVEVGKKKKNLMIVGDGMDSTVITGSLNVVDGSTTFKSATLAAVGDGFIAQDIWFKNTAGPQKHQAVALRVGADQAVINRCRIDAFQDTLYAHSNRQFYRDSTITGTVDFIFGNAAVVFQNCKIEARRPMDNQKNMVTAQGRIDPNQNTGTSFQNCQIIASSDLEPVKMSIKTYLGRPWKEYSRTVFMQSKIGDVIDPVGWAEWNGDFALKTLYYGEYLNTGPGADVSKRVKWPGYRVIKSPSEAQKFTVAALIQGGDWLGPTGVTFMEGL